MLSKTLPISTYDERGQRRMFPLGPSPAWAGLTKVAQELDPRLQTFVAGLKTDPKYLYELVFPMGAMEYWGFNANGDGCPEAALMHEGDDYGYKTFLKAHAFVHHQNRDPVKAIGDVPFAIYNHPMHRIEIVIRFDRAKANAAGADDFLKKMDAGNPVDLSMGLRTLHDVCSKCGHISKTDADRCYCIKYDLNKILDDGRKVGMINPLPRFFDISPVLVGADGLTKSIRKVASRGAAAARMTEKQATQYKLSDLIKRIPALAGPTIDFITDREPVLSDKVLRSSVDLPALLSTAAALGILLRPEEFQRAALSAIGRGELGEDLAASGTVFPPVEDLDSSVPMGPDRCSGIVCGHLLPSVPDRSLFGPVITRRIIVLKKTPILRSPMTEGREPLLLKISAAYNGYRQKLAEELPVIVRGVTLRNERYLGAIYPEAVEHAFTGLDKTSSLSGKGLEALLLFSLFPLAYLYAAHIKKREKGGGELSKIEEMISRRPYLSAAVMAGLAKATREAANFA